MVSVVASFAMILNVFACARSGFSSSPTSAPGMNAAVASVSVFAASAVLVPPPSEYSGVARLGSDPMPSIRSVPVGVRHRSQVDGADRPDRRAHPAHRLHLGVEVEAVVGVVHDRHAPAATTARTIAAAGHAAAVGANAPRAAERPHLHLDAAARAAAAAAIAGARPVCRDQPVELHDVGSDVHHPAAAVVADAARGRPTATGCVGSRKSSYTAPVRFGLLTVPSAPGPP